MDPQSMQMLRHRRGRLYTSGVYIAVRRATYPFNRRLSFRQLGELLAAMNVLAQVIVMFGRHQ